MCHQKQKAAEGPLLHPCSGKKVNKPTRGVWATLRLPELLVCWLLGGFALAVCIVELLLFNYPYSYQRPDLSKQKGDDKLMPSVSNMKLIFNALVGICERLDKSPGAKLGPSEITKTQPNPVPFKTALCRSAAAAVRLKRWSLEVALQEAAGVLRRGTACHVPQDRNVSPLL